jgi:hypothetical protein
MRGMIWLELKDTLARAIKGIASQIAWWLSSLSASSNDDQGVPHSTRLRKKEKKKAGKEHRSCYIQATLFLLFNWYPAHSCENWRLGFKRCICTLELSTLFWVSSAAHHTNLKDLIVHENNMRRRFVTRSCGCTDQRARQHRAWHTQYRAVDVTVLLTGIAACRSALLTLLTVRDDLEAAATPESSFERPSSR